ncbi:MAG: sensor histidine kinase [Pyrinomonadaceae bacterium]
MKKLALEAELRALRAQLDPHFLFNALTTIGYLIQTTPEKAFDTLMHLTALMRKVLRRVAGDSTTLGEELDLIDSYLAIEHARFEHRLRVRIDVPHELTMCRIPPLIVQPLVENGIKHAISQNSAGGEICITAHVKTVNGSINQAKKMLVIKVSDTGAGPGKTELAKARRKGIGLSNIEERLAHYYGSEAQCKMFSTSGFGTTVELHLPVNSSVADSPVPPVLARRTAKGTRA